MILNKTLNHSQISYNNSKISNCKQIIVKYFQDSKEKFIINIGFDDVILESEDIDEKLLNDLNGVL